MRVQRPNLAHMRVAPPAKGPCSARASMGNREYDGREDPVLKRRSDDTHGLDVKLSHRATSFQGFLPERNLGWSTTARLGMRGF